MATLLKAISARAPRLVANRPLTNAIEIARALQQFAADVYAFASAMLSTRRWHGYPVQCFLAPGLAGSLVCPCNGELVEVWALNDLSPTGDSQTLTLEIDGVAQGWLSFVFADGAALNGVQFAKPTKPVRVRRGGVLAFNSGAGTPVQAGQAEVTLVIQPDLVEV